LLFGLPRESVTLTSLIFWLSAEIGCVVGPVSGAVLPLVNAAARTSERPDCLFTDWKWLGDNGNTDHRAGAQRRTGFRHVHWVESRYAAIRHGNFDLCD
jgi:hypothetical protein